MYRNNQQDIDKYMGSHSDNSLIESIGNIDVEEKTTYIDTKKSNDFNNLSYEDVQINLRLLSDLKEGEKLMVSKGRYIQVDQRYIQGLRRYITSDSRSRSLDFINHIICWSKKYCNDAVENINKNKDTQINMSNLINIQKLLGGAQTGLGRLLITYGDDKHNKATIETFISTISAICDQDLKRAINAT